MARKSEEDLRAIEAEMDRIVQKEIQQRLGSYLQSKRASLTRETLADTGGTGYRLTPPNPKAASIYISTGGDEVAVGVGHGNFEFWHSNSSWSETLGKVLNAVAEGRFRESVRRGWIFERKVRMHFEGIPFSPSYARLTYDDESPPELGEQTHQAW